MCVFVFSYLLKLKIYDIIAAHNFILQYTALICHGTQLCDTETQIACTTHCIALLIYTQRAHIYIHKQNIFHIDIAIFGLMTFSQIQSTCLLIRLINCIDSFSFDSETVCVFVCVCEFFFLVVFHAIPKHLLVK